MVRFHSPELILVRSNLFGNWFGSTSEHMSCLMCSNKHLTVLAMLLTEDFQTEKLRELWQVNADAVKTRHPYNDDDCGGIYLEPNVFKSFEGLFVDGKALESIQLIKLIDSYIYQAVDNPEFQNSKLYRDLLYVKNNLICMLPAYDNCEWMI